MLNHSPHAEQKRREVQAVLAQLEAAPMSEAWALCRRIETLPDAYRETLDVFRSGIRSSDALVQMVSANSLVRFGAGETWVAAELEGLLLREERDIISGSAALHALQLLGTCESARAIAGVVPRTIEAPMRLSDKAAIITYALRSLAILGGVALNERAAFRQAIQFFDKQFEGLWASECFWELEQFAKNVKSDLGGLALARSSFPMANVSLREIQNLPTGEPAGRRFGNWTTVVDSYCAFAGDEVPERLMPREAAGRGLSGEARLLLLRNEREEHAIILCLDDAATISSESPVSSLVPGLGCFFDLDPTGTHALVYKLGEEAPAPFGALTLCATPSRRASRAEELFGSHAKELRKALFEGAPVPESLAQGVEAQRKSA